MRDNIGGVSMEDIMAAAMSGLDDEQPIEQSKTVKESVVSQDNIAVSKQPDVVVPTSASASVPVTIVAPTSTIKSEPSVVVPKKEETKNSTVVPVAPAPPVPQIQIHSFHCDNCGAPLRIPKNSRGVVICPDCKTESVIEGLVKNAEIADKENINSGVSLSTDVHSIHNLVVNVMGSSATVPLDIFEKSVVIKEEHIYVPAYLYYCNGTVSFTYEAGNQREHKTAIDLGDKTRVEWEKYMEWTQMNGMASTVDTAIAPGNKELSMVIQKLYRGYSPNDLIDVEELELPFDVQTYSYNLPQSAAFNEYVRPQMEELLDDKAEQSLKGKTYKNLSTAGGYNIHKDEIIRIFLGVYRVVYSYNGQEYSIFVTGDGKKYYYTDKPIDETRKNALKTLETEKEELVAKEQKFKTAIKVCLILAIFTFGITLAGVILFAILKKQTATMIEEKQEEINAFAKEVDSAGNQFRQQQGTLKGYYQGIA